MQPGATWCKQRTHLAAPCCCCCCCPPGRAALIGRVINYLARSFNCFFPRLWLGAASVSPLRRQSCPPMHARERPRWLHHIQGSLIVQRQLWIITSNNNQPNPRRSTRSSLTGPLSGQGVPAPRSPPALSPLAHHQLSVRMRANRQTHTPHPSISTATHLQHPQHQTFNTNTPRLAKNWS